MELAKTGFFINTSVKDYACDIDTKVVLIDGQRLSELMIGYGSGVAQSTTHEINRLDTDCFESP
jgi:restriction system protein